MLAYIQIDGLNMPCAIFILIWLQIPLKYQMMMQIEKYNNDKFNFKFLIGRYTKEFLTNMKKLL